MRKFLWSCATEKIRSTICRVIPCSSGLSKWKRNKWKVPLTFLLYFYKPTDPWSNSTWCASNDSFLICRLDLAGPFSIVPDITARHFDLWTAAHCSRSCSIRRFVPYVGNGIALTTSRLRDGSSKLAYIDFYYCRVIYRCHFPSNIKPPLCLSDVERPDYL